MQKITPFLWFDRNAEEAMNYYVSVFKGYGHDAEVVSINRYPEGPLEGPMKGMEGKVLTGVFRLDGNEFMALDGGPIFKFNESISFLVRCEDQKEIDYFWEKLSAVPESEQCGWLKDKYGLSWQIIPKDFITTMQNSDPKVYKRVMDAVMPMKKIIIADLEKARKG